MNELGISNRYWLALFIILLPSCTHQSRVSRPSLSKELSEELRARSFDLFIPVHATLLQDKSPLSTDEARAQFIITYTVRSDIESLRSLYQSEMERLGWHCMIEFIPHSDQEQASNLDSVTLIYRKPEAICCVVIDQKNQNSFTVRCMRSALL